MPVSMRILTTLAGDTDLHCWEFTKVNEFNLKLVLELGIPPVEPVWSLLGFTKLKLKISIETVADMPYSAMSL